MWSDNGDICITQDDHIDEGALKRLVGEAVALNLERA